MNEFKVLIATPYLTETLNEYWSDCFEQQIEKYGYNPTNLVRRGALSVNGHKTIVQSPNYNDRGRERIHPGDVDAHLIIAGCTEIAEEEAQNFAMHGFLIARYSIFYSRPSEYSGKKPEDSGYSLDIPKNPDIVRAFITNHDVIDSIIAREEKKIKKALKKFNRNFDTPVLMTPDLSKVLSTEA